MELLAPLLLITVTLLLMAGILLWPLYCALKRKATMSKEAREDREQAELLGEHDW